MATSGETGIALVDTNIVLYAYDHQAEDKHRIARDLLERPAAENRLIFSAQVLNELAAGGRGEPGLLVSIPCLSAQGEVPKELVDRPFLPRQPFPIDDQSLSLGILDQTPHGQGDEDES
jgi:hypothetical protein